MFHSKLYQPIVVVALLTLSLLLSSCSTLDSGSSSTKPPTESEAAKTGVTPVKAFTGVDPMADIQINAEIKKTYKDVAAMNRLKNYSQAISLLSIIQVKYPQLSGPDYQKARIYFNQGKFDQALIAIDSSLKNNQRNYYSLNLKGIILREQGEFDEAREIYLIAIEIYPPYPNSHLNLGVLADIYMRELSLALIQYREYMALVGGQDKTVANWVLELERRVKAGNK